MLLATTITGSGSDTGFTFFWPLRWWGRARRRMARARPMDRPHLTDQPDGHGLGADHLGFFAATRDGIIPNAPSGFNIEVPGVLARDGAHGYLELPRPDGRGEWHPSML